MLVEIIYFFIISETKMDFKAKDRMSFDFELSIYCKPLGGAAMSRSIWRIFKHAYERPLMREIASQSFFFRFKIENINN